jgi:hypothetical protein
MTQPSRSRRLVPAHVGRPTIRALGAGEPLPYGEVRRGGVRIDLVTPKVSEHRAGTFASFATKKRPG